MIERLLVAEPGEAAARIARTCERIGTPCITVTLAGDGGGVDTVGSAQRIELASTEPAALAAAAREAGADAVHPGYAGPDRLFALRSAWPDDGPALLAPSTETLARALDRVSQRAVAAEEDIRFVAGAHAAFTKLPDVIEAADALSYPIRLRGSRSGLVRSRRIDDEDQLFSTWDELQAEAASRGGGIVVDREIELARRLDVLLAAGGDGDVVALAELEVALAHESAGVDLEESPSPELAQRPDGEAVRLAMFDTASRFAARFGLRGLVTVRFLLDADGHFHVAGLRYGLPRHHGTFELVTGIDLVELELALHREDALPDVVHTLQPSGHAFGASLRSLDAATEPVNELRIPPQPHKRTRCDAYVSAGRRPARGDGDVLARVHAYGSIRHASMLGLDRMLSEIAVSAPHRTNARSLRGVLGDEAFRAGKYDVTLAQRLRYMR